MQRKKGISLIVLVITIIVMIILAATIILAINNNNIVYKAKDAVTETNQKQVEQAAMLAWSDAYVGGAKDVDELKDAVDKALENAKVDVTKYEIIVTTKGVTVKIKDTTSEPEASEKEDGTENIAPTKLSTPTVILNGDILTITDATTNKSYTESFEVYVEGEKKATITASSITTFDLNSLELGVGTYSITVKAVATEEAGIISSEASMTIEYTVVETTTLGDLVASAENYGDTVNYTVTVNTGTDKETTIDDWRVFYKQTIENEEYVYLIASEKLLSKALPTNIPGAAIKTNSVTIEEETKILGDICWTGLPTSSGTIQNPRLWLANWTNYSTYINGRAASYLLDETYWKQFKNVEKYGNYVVGAIGTPTAEMFISSWNEKRTTTNDTTKYNKKLALFSNGTEGYYVNDITENEPATSNSYIQTIARADDLYIWNLAVGATWWLASPSMGGMGVNDMMLGVNNDGVIYACVGYGNGLGVRPVVCLKSSTPAYAGGAEDVVDIVLK